MSALRDKPTETKPIFDPMINGKWIGLGISYGSYRDDESPHKGSVSSEQDILEDMTLLTNSADIS